MILVPAESGICMSEWTRIQLDIHFLVMWERKQACGGRVPMALQRSWYLVSGAASTMFLMLCLVVSLGRQF